ncbi:SphA family protein [Phreatobacter sp. AB_2022a]|uniref:SphA family protein n=1 Tax=Phreatobacter sp. AB_2022a TaxID=3003134 RepID=UPI0022872715|nr:transporter [Phreatobacter sp. AB_2022a]MCZ0737442.1 transporter [Phreatobacter sp. AB_2022a]
MPGHERDNASTGGAAAGLRGGIAGRALLALAASLVAPGLAVAQVSLPPMNLGDSSIQDAIAGPGFAMQETIGFNRAARFRDARGGLAGRPAGLTAASVLTQLIYVSEHRLFGAYWGAEIIIPVAHAALRQGGGMARNDTAIGDIFVSPLMLQWPKTMLLGRPFWQRLNLNVTLPTGAYDNLAPLNIGTNAWVLNPHYAFTYEVSDDWEVSGRLHYLWSSANADPPAALKARRIQAGQAVHLNASVSRAFGDNLRIGLSGYYLRQISDDRIDAVRVGGREQVLGIGPVVKWQAGRTALVAAAYWETLARDRPEGWRLSLRVARGF